MTSERIGLAAALATAFTADGAIDIGRTAALARRLVDRGCRHVGLFGTTGEGASIGIAERGAVLDGVIAAGIPPGRIIAGVSAASVADAAAQWRTAADKGCPLALITPPFYYKSVSEDGLELWFAALFETMRGAGRAILYAIPSVTAVPVTPGLVARLRRRFPDMVAGVKDSTGDLDNTLALLEAHGDLEILVGHEPHIAAAVRRGAAGSISGLANVLPERIAALVAGRDDPSIDALVAAVTAHPVVPAVKALIAHHEGDPAWSLPRPPLVPLRPEAVRALLAAL